MLPAFPAAFAYVEGPNRVYAPWYNNNSLSSSHLLISNTPNSTLKNNEFYTNYYQGDRLTQNYQDQSNQYQFDSFTNADSNSFKQEPEDIYSQQYRSPEYVLPGSPPSEGQMAHKDSGIYSGDTELRNTSQEIFAQTPENTNHINGTNDIKIKQELVKNGFESHFQSDEDSFLNTSDGINSGKIDDSSQSNKFTQFISRSDDESSSLSSSDKSSISPHLSIELNAADSSHNSEMINRSSKAAPVQPSLTTDSSGGEDNTVTSTAPPKHQCIDCSKVFNKACYLTQHNRCFHTGDKPFKCPRCGKRFPEEIAYQVRNNKYNKYTF